MKKFNFLLIAILVFSGLTAQVNYVEFTDDNTTYSQDFNTLESEEGKKSIPWTNGEEPIVGWYASQLMGGDSPQTVTIYSTGSTTTTAAAGLVSYGTSNDRALGSRISNAIGDMAYGVKLKNNTTSVIKSI